MEVNRESVKVASQKDDLASMIEAMSEQQREMQAGEIAHVCALLQECIALRHKYQHQNQDQNGGGQVDGVEAHLAVEPSEGGMPPYDPFTPSDTWRGERYTFEMRGGVMVVWRADVQPPPGGWSADDAAFPQPPDFTTFVKDLSRLLRLCSDAAVNSFCWRRLQRLESRFSLHVMEHELAEVAEQREVSHRDFYNMRKVDTHVHLAAAMNQKHLLRFIKKKVRTEGQTHVIKDDLGNPMTLQQAPPRRPRLPRRAHRAPSARPPRAPGVRGDGNDAVRP